MVRFRIQVVVVDLERKKRATDTRDASKEELLGLGNQSHSRARKRELAVSICLEIEKSDFLIDGLYQAIRENCCCLIFNS